MNSWMGKTKAELFQKWGVPNTITDDGQGGEILVYTSTESTGKIRERCIVMEATTLIIIPLLKAGNIQE